MVTIITDLTGYHLQPRMVTVYRNIDSYTNRVNLERENMVVAPVYRITTFVPPDRLDALLAGIGKVVPLQYGLYDQAAWWAAEGVEQYRPLPGSNPSSGIPGQVSRVASVRLELVIPRDPALLSSVITSGLLPNHPWEEPAVFIDESSITLSHPR
jgi:hypothetical protein